MTGANVSPRCVQSALYFSFLVFSLAFSRSSRCGTGDGKHWGWRGRSSRVLLRSHRRLSCYECGRFHGAGIRYAPRRRRPANGMPSRGTSLVWVRPDTCSWQRWGCHWHSQCQPQLKLPSSVATAHATISTGCSRASTTGEPLGVASEICFLVKLSIVTSVHAARISWTVPT